MFLILFAFCKSLFQSYSHSFDFIASDLFLLDDSYSSVLCQVVVKGMNLENIISYDYLHSIYATDEASCMRMVNEYYSSSEGKYEFLVAYLNEEASRGKFITDIYHHPAMSVLELLRGTYVYMFIVDLTKCYVYSNQFRPTHTVDVI